MPLGDVTYQDDALDAVVGSWPSSGATYRYWYSDPQAESDPTTVEIDLTGTGLSNGSFSAGAWASASGGAKATSSPISLGTATADIDDRFNYWGVVDSGGLIVYSDVIDEPFGVNDGDVVSFTPQLSWGQ